MSIVRIGDDGSDVYIIGIHDNLWECVGCVGPSPCSKIPEFFDHLKWHREKGDVVPEHVEQRILACEEVEQS